MQNETATERRDHEQGAVVRVRKMSPEDRDEMMLAILMWVVCVMNCVLGYLWAIHGCVWGALFQFSAAMFGAVTNPMVWGKW